MSDIHLFLDVAVSSQRSYFSNYISFGHFFFPISFFLPHITLLQPSGAENMGGGPCVYDDPPLVSDTPLVSDLNLIYVNTVRTIYYILFCCLYRKINVSGASRMDT